MYKVIANGQKKEEEKKSVPKRLSLVWIWLVLLYRTKKKERKKTLTQILYYGKWVENSRKKFLSREIFHQTFFFSVLSLIKTYKIYLISNTPPQSLSKIINSFADLQITPLIAFILIHKGIHAYIILYLIIFGCLFVCYNREGVGGVMGLLCCGKIVTGFLNNHSHTPY